VEFIRIQGERQANNCMKFQIAATKKDAEQIHIARHQFWGI
jgi:hypothetical protein